MKEIHIIDIIIVAAILISLLAGYIRGLVYELLSLASIAVSSWLSVKIAPKIFKVFSGIANEISAKIASYAICFVISVVLFSILTHMCKAAIKKTSFKNLDRLFGSLFGFLRGLVLCCAIEIFVTNLAHNYNVSYKTMSSSSDLYKHIYRTSNLITIMLPHKISEYIIESVDNDRRIEILSFTSDGDVSLHNTKKLPATRSRDSRIFNNNDSQYSGIAKLSTKKTKDDQITSDKRKKINKTISDIITEYIDE